jgi:hypothetical protein
MNANDPEVRERAAAVLRLIAEAAGAPPDLDLDEILDVIPEPVIVDAIDNTTRTLALHAGPTSELVCTCNMCLNARSLRTVLRSRFDGIFEERMP